ncbi:MAG: hypothetical protein GY894_04075 [Planctomycetes bacterium]|nr:hypothetical protein [Planctomycetota bacterium]MCP4838524.1 hypothetical protein [Planctomycetota bacterium]
MIPTFLSHPRTTFDHLRGYLLLIPVICGLAAAPNPVTPLPKANTLLQRFIRAVGGEAAIRNIGAMSAQGKIILPKSDQVGSFNWIVADNNRCRFNMEFPQLGRRSFGSDGVVGWESVELDDAVQERDLELAEIDRRRRKANWFELALTLPVRATEFHTIGRASFDGTETFEVRMLDPSRRVHHLFFDTDSHLLLGVRLIEQGPLGPADVTIRFSDWKPVGSLQLFHSVSIDHADLQLKLEFEKVSLEPIPAAAFARPEVVPASKVETE